MHKGSFKKFISGNTAHRFPKVVTLAVTSCVLVGMIAVDASASTDTQPTAPTTDSATATATTTTTAATTTTTTTKMWNTTQLRAFSNHWRPQNSATAIQPVDSPTTTSTTTSTPTSPTTSPTATSTTTATTSTATPSSGSTTTSTSTQTTTTVAPAPTATVTPTTTTTDPPPTTTTVAPAPVLSTAFPVGTLDSAEPSGMSPPSAGSVSGFTQTYVTDFSGTDVPGGWFKYSGTPGGDPGGQWAISHVNVSGGLLSLNTYQDPAFNNEWVTGGLCQCGHTQTYGAYFVRSRVTGAGPTGVELLWPTVGWPPEIDFNETGGGTSSTTATDIWGPASAKSQKQIKVSIDMTQWHTWGVVWTPSTITYTVDGRAWGSMAATTVSIPNVPMTLDLQQQTWCSSGFACPTTPQSMQVDWVAEYS